MPFHVREIESLHNQNFRLWRRYLQSPEDPSCPWIGVEGLKQISDLSERYPLRTLVFAGSLPPSPLLGRSQLVFKVKDSLFHKLSAVRTDQGMVAFFDKPSWTWDDLSAHVLYLWQLQDPGNVGTILRTALAAGGCSIVASPKTVSFFNDKVVRASASALFQTPFLEQVPLQELRARGYRITAAVTAQGASLFEHSFRPPEVIVIGSEGPGLPDSIIASADSLLHVPMAREMDSLNAAVAASLIAYEIYRRSAPVR